MFLRRTKQNRKQIDLFKKLIDISRLYTEAMINAILWNNLHVQLIFHWKRFLKLLDGSCVALYGTPNAMQWSKEALVGMNWKGVKRKQLFTQWTFDECHNFYY